MSLKSQPKSTILYLDRNLGAKIVPGILNEQDIPCEIHDDHLDSDAPDEAWVELCSEQNWIAITKDTRLRHNETIKLSIKRSKVGIVVITAKNLTGEQLGDLIANSYDKISKFSSSKSRPFLATLSRGGSVSLVKFR